MMGMEKNLAKKSWETTRRMGEQEAQGRVGLRETRDPGVYRGR